MTIPYNISGQNRFVFYLIVTKQYNLYKFDTSNIEMVFFFENNLFHTVV